MEKILLLLRQELIDLKQWFSKSVKQQEDLKSSFENLVKVITEQKPPIINVQSSKVPDIVIPEIKIPDIKIPEIYIPDITIPDIKIPNIKVPKAEITVKVPTIKIPEIKIPTIKMPDEMDIKGWVRLQDVDIDHPLPVELRDKNGKVVNLLEGLTTIVGGGGGGMKINKISDIANSAWGSLLPGEGRLKIESAGGSSGLTDTELRASSVPVAQASGASWSVEASQTSSWLVSQVSGANWSVSVDRLAITTVSDGIRTTTAGTAVALLASATTCKKITITALPNNTDLVVIGGTTVVASSDGRRGVPLFSGSSLTLEIDDVNKVFIDSIVTGEGVSFIYLN